MQAAMKSPFPGMDPYLEPHWLDIHASLAIGARDSLNSDLPDDLVAHVEERVAIESRSGEEHLFGRVFEPAAGESPAVADTSGTIRAPYRLLAQVEPMTERFVRVTEVGTERLVSVLEFVSPTNKRGEGLSAFRSKRAELLLCGVNFVEVDLHRAGDWQLLLRPHRSPRGAATPYRVTIRVPTDPAAVYLYPIRLQDCLPAISIPLRQRDPEVKIDLQGLIDRAYSSGRYDRCLDYSQPCEPPLDPDQAAWTEALLRQAGKQ
jgi:hypothetical protein